MAGCRNLSKSGAVSPLLWRRPATGFDSPGPTGSSGDPAGPGAGRASHLFLKTPPGRRRGRAVSRVLYPAPAGAERRPSISNPGRPGPPAADPEVWGSGQLPVPFGTPSLFGLAPGEVCLATAVARSPVGSYPTFSPLPSPVGRRFPFCGTFSPSPVPGIARRPALRCPDFPPSREGGRPPGPTASIFTQPASCPAVPRRRRRICRISGSCTSCRPRSRRRAGGVRG